MGEYGRKVKIRVTETNRGMHAELPLFECKGRKTRIGYKIIEWMIGHGYIRYSDLLYLAMFKNFDEFGKADGDKEIQVRMVGKNG